MASRRRDRFTLDELVEAIKSTDAGLAEHVGDQALIPAAGGPYSPEQFMPSLRDFVKQHLATEEALGEAKRLVMQRKKLKAQAEAKLNNFRRWADRGFGAKRASQMFGLPEAKVRSMSILAKATSAERRRRTMKKKKEQAQARAPPRAILVLRDPKK